MRTSRFESATLRIVPRSHNLRTVAEHDPNAFPNSSYDRNWFRFVVCEIFIESGFFTLRSRCKPKVLKNRF